MGKSALEDLEETPERFTFDAAVRILERAAPEEDGIRFVAPPSLAYPSGEVLAVAPPAGGRKAQLVSTVIGLTGPSAALPRWYTELVAQSVRGRARAIAEFFDLLAQRLVEGFAAAASKYRVHRSAEKAWGPDARGPEPVGEAVLALTGFASPQLAERFPPGADPLQYYAGFFAARPRSAERLQMMLCDFLERPVEIVEFSGAWLAIARDGQSRLPVKRQPGQFNALGLDAAIGTRAWSQQARFLLRIGPMSRAEFDSLLPGRPALIRLASLVRAYVGFEYDFAVNLLLESTQAPPLQLARGEAGAPRLGWTSWLPVGMPAVSGPRIRGEAVFDASVAEGFGAARHPAG